MSEKDCGPALLLLAHAPRQQLCERRFQPFVTFDLAANVADHAAQIGPQRLERPVGARELLGMGIALVPAQGELAHPCIGLSSGSLVARMSVAISGVVLEESRISLRSSGLRSYLRNFMGLAIGCRITSRGNIAWASTGGRADPMPRSPLGW